MPILEAFVFATILCGFFGIILKKNLIMKIVSMDVMSAGVIAYYVLMASREGLLTPILGQVKKGTYADPVPQAVILTAIVIGLSIQALMLVAVPLPLFFTVGRQEKQLFSTPRLLFEMG